MVVEAEQVAISGELAPIQLREALPEQILLEDLLPDPNRDRLDEGAVLGFVAKRQRCNFVSKR